MRPDVLIAGAGPAGLAMRLMLACHRPDLVATVVDPSGRWLATWHQQFSAQQIPHLRSPAVHHPHPDPFALLREASEEQLVRQAGTTLPTTDVFARFCHHCVADHGLGDEVRTGRLVAVTPLRTRVVAEVVDGGQRQHVEAGHVIVATNRRVPAWPSWAPNDDPRVRHASRVDLLDAPRDARIVIVGGGMSAGHLSVGACSRGNHVTLVTRRNLQVRRYDTHPTWLGPRKLLPFRAEPDPAVRRRQVDLARGGGSMPHWLARRLRELQEAGRLDHRSRTTVTAVEDHGSTALVHLDDGTCRPADEVWLSTGARAEVDTDPLFAALRLDAPTAVHDGMPVLAEDLAWPGTRVHLMGAAASLVLGPTAGNLAAHRKAARRILASIQGEDPRRAEHHPLPTRHRRERRS